MDEESPLLSSWPTVLAALEHELPERQFNTWVRPLQALELDDGSLRLLAPNRYSADWIQQNLQPRLAELLFQICGFRSASPSRWGRGLVRPSR